MSSTMSVSELMQNRYSVRSFSSKPVPKETIMSIIETARLAPSNSNTQPWHMAIVAGEPLQDLRKAIFEYSKAGGKPHPAFPPGGVGLKGKYKQRQIDCAVGYWDVMGVTREDQAGRMKLLAKNWEFFGAPQAAFISMPETMHRANSIDIGIFLQSFLLLCAEKGIGTIAQGALGAFPDVVRKFADIPDGNAIMCGVSFGYEETGDIINTVRMPREDLASMSSYRS